VQHAWGFDYPIVNGQVIFGSRPAWVYALGPAAHAAYDPEAA